MTGVQMLPAEVVEVMSVADAERLDKRIRLVIKNIDDNVDKLRDLIRQAKARMGYGLPHGAA